MRGRISDRYTFSECGAGSDVGHSAVEFLRVATRIEPRIAAFSMAELIGRYVRRYIYKTYTTHFCGSVLVPVGLGQNTRNTGRVSEEPRPEPQVLEDSRMQKNLRSASARLGR